MESSVLFERIDNLLLEINELLKKCSIEMHKRGLQPQKASDIQNGVVYKDSLYIPLDAIEHRILVDGYETLFLDTYILLFNEVFKNRNNPISQLALRTLAEMGFPRTQILFSDLISYEEKHKYKLLIMLADYGFMGRNHPENILFFEKLLTEDESLFSEKQLKILKSFLNSTKEIDIKNHSFLTKKTRQLIDSIQDELFKKTSILPFFNPTNIDSLFSGFSHILHGNILLLKDILENKRPTQITLRVYWFLLLTSLNVINHVVRYLDNKELEKELTYINKSHEEIASFVKNYWESI